MRETLLRAVSIDIDASCSFFLGLAYSYRSQCYDIKDITAKKRRDLKVRFHLREIVLRAAFDSIASYLRGTVEDFLSAIRQWTRKDLLSSGHLVKWLPG